MTVREQYRCKRKALGMSQKEFAAISGVDEGMISLFEQGYHIPEDEYRKIKEKVEEYIRSFSRKDYLTTRIIEETLMLQAEDDSEHLKTLSHLMIHVSKLNMMYVDD